MNLTKITESAIFITGSCILITAIIWAANWWLTLLIFS